MDCATVAAEKGIKAIVAAITMIDVVSLNISIIMETCKVPLELHDIDLFRMNN